jgi:predicted alpha/beta superfamily hydrolase
MIIFRLPAGQAGISDFRFRRATLFFLSLSLSLSSCKPSDPIITIEVESLSPLDEDEQIFITGNQPVLGNWNPSSVMLTKDDNIWTGTFSFPVGTQLEFKFTKGSWNAEAVTDEGRVPSNYQFTILRDTTVHYTIPFWKDSVLNTGPQITGDFHIHEDFAIQGLSSRRVIVWLPPTYSSDTMHRYPVLYMQDGQNVFDPYTSTLGYDWRIDEIADSLIRNDEIEEFICVSVYCNPDVRAKEYSDDPDLGEKYQDFMCCQLKPWIDSVYRTKTDAQHTAVMGASMGGLISFILAWEYPDVFGKAACMSPAFSIDINGIKVDYVENVAADLKKKDIELYIDNGTLDLETILQPGIDEMKKTLDDREYEYTWFLDRGAPHNERAWSARAWRPLVQFFSKG